MAVCPFVAALILANKEEKSYGIKKLVKTTFDYKKIKKKIWYVPIILLMPAVMLLSYGVMRFMARPLPERNIQLFAIPILFALFFIGALCEEIGWMGYAIDPMQDRLGALAASLIMGAIWGIWHVVPYIQANHTLEWIVWQCIFSAAARVLIVWLYNSNGKSVFSSILFHTMINLSFSLFPNYGSHYDPAVTGIITAIVAVFAIFLWGPKSTSQHRHD